MGAGFSNVAHFKKWYKKAFLGISDFSMLQAYAAWNLAIDHQEEGSREGRKIRHCLVKWEFYAVAAEELKKTASLGQNLIASLHRPEEIPTGFKRKILMCTICSMEESTARNMVGSVEKICV